MEEGNAHVVPKYLYVVGGVAILAVIGAFVWRAALQQQAAKAALAQQQAAQALAQSQAAATNTQVPATSNPIKDATPAVNPVETANPFATSTINSNNSDNGYRNPFQ